MDAPCIGLLPYAVHAGDVEDQSCSTKTATLRAHACLSGIPLKASWGWERMSIYWIGVAAGHKRHEQREREANGHGHEHITDARPHKSRLARCLSGQEYRIRLYAPRNGAASLRVCFGNESNQLAQLPPLIGHAQRQPHRSGGPRLPPPTPGRAASCDRCRCLVIRLCSTLSVVVVLRLALVGLMLVSAACNGGSQGSGQCAPGVACDCTYADGAYYNCGSNEPLPAFSAGGYPTSLSCSPVGATCAGCPVSLGGLTCLCTDAGPEAGARWECVGTEYPCKGP
jgi:hypothetical protein